MCVSFESALRRQVSPMRVAILCILMLLLAPVALAADMDRDGIPDDADNCPTVKNNDQADQNSDGVGDACDRDHDGVEDNQDNCPDLENFDQADDNADGVGDACDGDGDAVLDEDDNCPTTSNASQNDTNEDGIGDACDTDSDGVDDSEDICVGVFDPDQKDMDQDGLGDACDSDRDGDDVPNTEDAFPDDPNYARDRDNDDVPDALDQCDGHDDRIDNDQDGTPDGCDPSFTTSEQEDTLAAFEQDKANKTAEDNPSTLSTLRAGPFGNPTYWVALSVMMVLFVGLVAFAAFKRNR